MPLKKVKLILFYLWIFLHFILRNNSYYLYILSLLNTSFHWTNVYYCIFPLTVYVILSIKSNLIYPDPLSVFCGLFTKEEGFDLSLRWLLFLFNYKRSLMLLIKEDSPHKGRKIKHCRLIYMVNKDIRLIPLTELGKCEEIEVE